jgi:hypothetical protein
MEIHLNGQKHKKKIETAEKLLDSPFR